MFGSKAHDRDNPQQGNRMGHKKKQWDWLPSFQLSTHTMLDPINDITICIKIKIINKHVRQ